MSGDYHIEDEVQQRAYDSRLMRRLLQYVRPFRWVMAGAIALMLVASIVSNMLPQLNMRIIDNYIANPARTEMYARQEEAALTPEELRELERGVAEDSVGLTRMVLIIFGLLLVETFIRYVQSLILAFVGQKTLLTMRLDVFKHLQNMSLRFLDHHPVGRLMTRVTNDVERIQETIVSGMVQVFSEFFTIFVVLGFMFYNNPRLALITLIPVPFVFVTSAIFRKRARQAYMDIRKRIASVNAYTQENVQGMRVVQIFNREEHNFEQFDERNASHRDAWFRQIRYYAAYFSVIDFLGTISVALIIFYGGRQMLTNVAAASGASIGMFFAYVQWAERLFGPVRHLADRYNMLLEAMASSERIFDLLDTPPDVQDKEDAVPCDGFRGEVEFDDVWFAYEPGEFVLKGINLKIRPGERVAVVGHTGAGKTSLINLLGRFYEVDQGATRIDGIDVRDYRQAEMRRHIGTVLQDVFLFSGSIHDNISLGKEDLDEDRLRACAEHVNAARFIERMPGKYSYDVGERGGNLSMGQRQLLAFARTLAHDPDILVLDEATSSIDTETELLIQDAIAKLMEGRTCIVIAHRLSTVQHADRIVVMHHGEIREQGSHQELLAKRGLYYTLYQLQYKDQAV